MDKENMKGLDLKIKVMIISIIAFLATLIGVSLAWFRGNTITGSTNLFVGSAAITLNYHGTSSITNVDLAPGEKHEKTFEVTNDGTTAQTYNILWKNVTNSLVDKNYFMYTIENTDTGEQLLYPRYLPSNSTHIVYDISIPANTTQHYKLTIYYVDDPKYNQLQNKDLTFIGDLTIDSANNARPDEEVLSIFVNGVHSNYLPTLSSYTIDTTRTFCTDGSSIAIVNGSVSISSKTSTTACELYLVSSTPTAITDDPYNLLVIDLDGATLTSTIDTTYRYSGDIVDLGVPEKSGYAFLGWQVSGGGTTIIDNTKVKMGTTYSYVKPTWTHGYWSRTVQTCTQGAPISYTRQYRVCSQYTADYTKQDKVCEVSSWNETTSVCGVATVTKKTYKCKRSISSVTGTCRCRPSGCPQSESNCVQTKSCTINAYNCSSVCTGMINEGGGCTINYKYSYPTSPTSTSVVASTACSAATPSCSTASHYNSGNTKVTCGTPKTYDWTSAGDPVVVSTCTLSGTCSTEADFDNQNTGVTNCDPLAYNFGAITTSIVSVADYNTSCTNQTDDCDSTQLNNHNIVCTPNYAYSLASSVQTDTPSVCTVSDSNFTCTVNSLGEEYTTTCTPLEYGYGWNGTTTQAGSCFVETEPSCTSSSAGKTYVSGCQLIEN